MKRVSLALLAAAAVFAVPIAADNSRHHDNRPPRQLQLVEATVDDLQDALESGLITSEQLIRMYLERIDAYEDLINAFIYINPDAIDEARARDRERRHKRGKHFSPLFGIPVLLKDNVNTNDMPTTAGSIALEGSIPPHARSSRGSSGAPARSSSARRR
jgi:amidase